MIIEDDISKTIRRNTTWNVADTLQIKAGYTLSSEVKEYFRDTIGIEPISRELWDISRRRWDKNA